MTIGLIILGLIFGAAAINGTISDQSGKPGLGSQLNSDLFGSGGGAPGVLKWFGAMIALAAIFKMMKMPGTGKAFLALVIIAYFAKNPGIITQISTQISGLGGAAAGSTGSASSTASGQQTAQVTPGTAAPGWYNTTITQPIVKPPDSAFTGSLYAGTSGVTG
jgi:hypothetical protein